MMMMMMMMMLWSSSNALGWTNQECQGQNPSQCSSKANKEKHKTDAGFHNMSQHVSSPWEDKSGTFAKIFEISHPKGWNNSAAGVFATYCCAYHSSAHGPSSASRISRTLKYQMINCAKTKNTNTNSNALTSTVFEHLFRVKVLSTIWLYSLDMYNCQTLSATSADDETPAPPCLHHWNWFRPQAFAIWLNWREACLKTYNWKMNIQQQISGDSTDRKLTWWSWSDENLQFTWKETCSR